MTVTSARHCGIFISTTVSSAEIFPTWENYLGSMRGWEGEMGREAGLWPSCISLPTLVVSVLLSILTFSPFTLVIFIFLFLPPLLLLSSSNTELKQWCDLSPCHSFIFIGYFSPSSSFFFFKIQSNVASDTLLTERHRVRDSSWSGPSEENQQHFLSTLSRLNTGFLKKQKNKNERTKIVSGNNDIHLNVSSAASPDSGLLLESGASSRHSRVAYLGVWQERVSHSPGCHCLFFCSQINKSWIFHDCLLSLR